MNDCAFHTTDYLIALRLLFQGLCLTNDVGRVILILNKEWTVVIMQVLKDEVQEKILQSALTLFLKYGFEKTSIEKISKQAHISKSNLYNYFKSKDEIFERLTSSAANEFIKVIEQFSTNQFAPKFCEAGFEDMMVTRIFDLIDKNRNELLLLMLGSKGTKYEHLKEQLTNQIATKFMFDYKSYFSDSDPIVTIITHNLFDGIINVTIYSQSSEELHFNLQRLIRYHVKGFSALISD